MSQKYSVLLSKIIKDHEFEVIYTPKNPNEIYITCCETNRPGLILVSQDEYFDPDRIQFLGLAEISFLNGLTHEEREKSLTRFLKKRPSALIITRNLEVPEEMLALTEKYEIPLLRTEEPTSEMMATLISYLNVELAPRVTRHGVLVEVYGEGILMLGDSGVGKSETAVELIKRGHRLIADDAVEIRRVSSKSLVGSAPDNIRHFMELRGIGIINARRIFGIGAVKLTEKIDLVIQMELWDESKTYDRLGLEQEKFSILDISVPQLTVPVKPGRNLAVIIEIAAMNNRQKKMGYNAARELLHQLGMNDIEPMQEEVDDWNSL